MKYLIYLGLTVVVIGINHSFIEVINSFFDFGIISIIIKMIGSFTMGIYLGGLTIVIKDKLKLN